MNKKGNNYIPLIVMLLIATVVVILLLTGKLNVERIIDAVQDNKMTALLVILALYVLKGFSFGVPYPAIAVGAAMVFGIAPAIIINAVGTALCLTASYTVGRFSKGISFDGLMEKYPKLAPYFRNVVSYGFTLCFTTHALHLQMEAQGVLYGLMRTSYGKYISSSMLAMIPQFLCYTIIGNKLDFTNPTVWVFIIIDAAMLITGIIMAKKNIFTKKKD